MAKLDGEYFKSRKQFLVGLLLAGAGVALFLTVGYTEVRYDLKGLREVRGRVIQAESHKPGRHSSYQLFVTLDTGGGEVRLWQDATGYFADRLAPGQSIRAWVDPPDEDTAPPSSLTPSPLTVWQIERGPQIVMPVMEVGDRVFRRMLWDGGAALIPLLGGLFMVGRHLLRYHDDDEERRAEGNSA